MAVWPGGGNSSPKCTAGTTRASSSCWRSGFFEAAGPLTRPAGSKRSSRRIPNKRFRCCVTDRIDFSRYTIPWPWPRWRWRSLNQLKEDGRVFMNSQPNRGSELTPSSESTSPAESSPESRAQAKSTATPPSPPPSSPPPAAGERGQGAPEQADVVAGLSGTGVGVVTLARLGPRRVEYSEVDESRCSKATSSLDTLENSTAPTR